MRHLLVVDDEPNLVDGLSQALTEVLGDEVSISKAYSGNEAVALLSQSPVDLVITDIRMPDINGMDLLQIIQARQMHCRVLVITGYDEFNIIHEVVKHPCIDGFLLKNEGDEEIINSVKKSLAGIHKAEKTQRDLALAKRGDRLLRELKLKQVLGLLPYNDESTVLSETQLAVDLSKPMLLVAVRSFSDYIRADAIVWLDEQVRL